MAVLKLVPLLVVLSLWLGCSSVAAGGNTWPLQRVHVYLNNLLYIREAPNYHPVLHTRCHSEDNNLEDHAITYFNQQEINFKVNLYGTTYFKCDIGWTDHQGNLKTVSNYNIYDFKRDNMKCKRNDCFWNAREDGLYFLEVDSKVNPKLMIGWTTIPGAGKKGGK
ncbi:hypothetical protein ACHQM5_012877 [Ranunculus cassubicifolius]